MQLDDLLFTQGFGTRYDCAQMILAGAIEALDGTPLTDPEFEVDPQGFQWRWRGHVWTYQEKLLIAMDKPAGYECSMKPSAHPSIMSLLPAPFRKRGVQPVGRLDVDTTGLLLFTDDGRLLHKLIHPKHHVPKTYVASLKHAANDTMVARLLAGVVLDDDPKPVKAQAAVLLTPTTLQLTLTQGKYHQVKRMIAACGNRCEALRRESFGAIQLQDFELQPGQWCLIADARQIWGER